MSYMRPACPALCCGASQPASQTARHIPADISAELTYSGHELWRCVLYLYSYTSLGSLCALFLVPCSRSLEAIVFPDNINEYLQRSPFTVFYLERMRIPFRSNISFFFNASSLLIHATLHFLRAQCQCSPSASLVMSSLSSARWDEIATLGNYDLRYITVHYGSVMTMIIKSSGQ